jgi:hypothetical protein
MKFSHRFAVFLLQLPDVLERTNPLFSKLVPCME